MEVILKSKKQITTIITLLALIEGSSRGRSTFLEFAAKPLAKASGSFIMPDKRSSLAFKLTFFNSTFCNKNKINKYTHMRVSKSVEFYIVFRKE